MGVDIQQYRGRIGKFGGGRGLKVFTINQTKINWLDILVSWVIALIRILLTLSGINENPGPSGKMSWKMNVVWKTQVWRLGGQLQQIKEGKYTPCKLQFGKSHTARSRVKSSKARVCVLYVIHINDNCTIITMNDSTDVAFPGGFYIVFISVKKIIVVNCNSLINSFCFTKQNTTTVLRCHENICSNNVLTHCSSEHNDDVLPDSDMEYNVCDDSFIINSRQIFDSMSDTCIENETCDKLRMLECKENSSHLFDSNIEKKTNIDLKRIQIEDNWVKTHSVNVNNDLVKLFYDIVTMHLRSDTNERCVRSFMFLNSVTKDGSGSSFNNSKSDTKEKSDSSLSCLYSGTDKKLDDGFMHPKSGINEENDSSLRDLKSVVYNDGDGSAVYSKSVTNIDGDGTAIHSQSVANDKSEGSADAHHILKALVDDQTTDNLANPKLETSICPEKNIPKCSVVTKSHLQSTSCKTEEVDDKGSSIKELLRESTTMLEPIPPRPVNIIAAPALKPDNKVDAEEPRVQRDSTTTRARNSEVFTDSAGARARSLQRTSDKPASHSQYRSDQDIIMTDGYTYSREGLHSMSPSMSDNVADSGRFTSLPVNGSLQFKPLESAHAGLEQAPVVVDEHSTSTMPKNINKPNGANDFESNGIKQSVSLSPDGATQLSFNGNVEHSNIAQPTPDEQNDDNRLTQTDEPRNQFEPVSAIINKLSLGEDVPPQVTMRYEMLRLYTLHSYPRENKPYIIRLAQAGFYYANNGDEVVCYCCGRRRNYWEETDNPMVVHQRLNPNCKFLLKNDEVNVKIHAAGTNGRVSNEKANITFVTSHTGSNSGLVSSETNSRLVSTGANSGLVSAGSQNSGNVEVGSTNLVATSSKSTESASSSNTRQRDPQRSHGGFVMQTAESKHPSAAEVQQQTADPAPTVSSPGATGGSTSNTRRKKKKIKFQKYIDVTKRRATFEGCSDLAVPISSLVEAGLFYTGYGDCCRCHVCGIGLRHWTINDDPWVEHARWSKDCDFVKTQKGQEYIDLVHMAVGISQNGSGSSSNGDSNSTNGGQSQTSQTSSEVDHLLHGNAAQSLLEMGYSTDIIRQALQAVLDNDGRSAINAVKLTEKVFEIENQRKQSGAASSSKESTVANVQDDKGQTSAASQPADKKSQLLEQKRLAKENAMLKEQSICTLCKKNAVCIVFLPCGHLVTCESCAATVKNCNLPECGKYIKGTVRTYFA